MLSGFRRWDLPGNISGRISRGFMARQAARIRSKSRRHIIAALLPVVALCTPVAFVGNLHPNRAFRGALKWHGVAVAAGKSGHLQSLLRGIHRKMPDMRECDRIHSVQGYDDIGSRHLTVREP